MTRLLSVVVATFVLACLVAVLACGSGSSQSDGPSGTGQPTAVPEEDNPPGDIPDDQAFVPYHSDAGGYTLDTPEGWARTESGANVSFADKLHIISVDSSNADQAPTADSVTAEELPALASRTEAFEQVSVKKIDLPAGPAVLVKYRANSQPDSVTGKKIRMEVDRYELFKDGKLAALSISAPAGSDNVDVSRQISRSFTWD